MYQKSATFKWSGFKPLHDRHKMEENRSGSCFFNKLKKKKEYKDYGYEAFKKIEAVS